MAEDQRETLQPCKAILLKIISENEEVMDEIQKMGKDLVQSTQQLKDVSRPFYTFVESLQDQDRPKEWWNGQVGAFQAAKLKADETLNLKKQGIILHATNSTCVNTVVSGINSFYVEPDDTKSAVFHIHPSINMIHKVVSSYPHSNSIKESLDRLGISKDDKDHKSSYRHLEDANAALGQNVSVISTLIPLRESINTTLADLIRRQPQEKTGSISKKLVSLGRNCGFDGLDEAHFQRLAKRGEEVMDKLSDAKSANLKREEIIQVFNEGQTFFDAFLKSIDEKKLKPQ